MYDFIWWYIGVIREGVLTEVEPVIRTKAVYMYTEDAYPMHRQCAEYWIINASSSVIIIMN